jgi:formylglycine-generating enzyme required for sulfatase activity
MIWICFGFLVALTALAQSQNASKSTPGVKSPAQIEFVKIAPGEFMMGCLPGDMDCLEDEVPRHKVRLTKGFELGKYEVTQAQWEAVMGANSNPSDTKGPKNPVDSVNKAEIHAFLENLNAQNDGYKYRLPTEAEWEYAARGGRGGANGGPPKGFDAHGRLLINGGGAEGLPLFRGGGWDNFAPYLRLSSRYYYYGTDLKVGDIGFRLAREPQ